MLALLLDHAWANTLEDAVSRTSGTPLHSEFVEATTLAELAPAVVAAAEPDAGDKGPPLSREEWLCGCIAR